MFEQAGHALQREAQGLHTWHEKLLKAYIARPEPWPRRLDVKARRWLDARLDARLDTSMQRLDASTSPVGVTMIRRIKLDANGSLDGSTQPRRLDARLNSSMPGLSFHPSTYLQWQHTQ